ncbi:hypothetical protein P4574_23695 [Priestia megaterium]|uniref:hypothetical protein n=1 Tax=Priestia megaterium TaxID=1404 RepID=UPI002E1DD26A|nr:hypothetical protein [Priestia megaterium]
MSYLEWNNLIANHFFNRRMAGREVLLFVDEGLINELGNKIGEELDDFISSVIEGPPWVNNNRGVCQKALQTFDNWRAKKYLKFPPYVGYLALFVLAGYVEDENVSQIAYYPKLRTLLGESERFGQYPSFDKMINLWMDLERWSVEDKLEELGQFKVRIRGAWRHVGLPLSQTMISSKERRKLSVIFNNAGINISDAPSYETLRSELLNYGEKLLSKKTIRLLKGEEKNKELLQALLDLVKDELTEWDGYIPTDLISSNHYTYSKMKLCIRMNTIVQNIAFTIRVNSQGDFPDDPLIFKKESKGNIQCSRSINGWSTEIKDENNILMDATEFNWLDGESIDDHKNKWKAHLRGASLRVFVSGKKYGLPDLVEAPRIERWCKFLVLCSGAYSMKIKEWMKSSCDEFREVPYKGIPYGWSLYQGINPKKSFIGIDALTFSDDMRIRFVEGIRLGNGNNFLSIAPPKIMIENPREDMVLTLNGILLQYDSNSQYWNLCDDLPVNEKLNLMVLYRGDEIKKLTFRLINPKISITTKDDFIRKKGLHLSEGPVNIGVITSPPTESTFNPTPPLPTHLSNEIFFIGQKVGEIYHWQGRNEIKLSWDPVWAIWKYRAKKWKVEFCSLQALRKCQIQEGMGDEKHTKDWKRVMCKMKKVIENPEFSPLSDLWDSYLEVARSV